MGTAEQVTAHVDAAFMLLGYCVIEKQGQIKGRADRGKACLINRPAVAGGLFCVFTVAAKPCGGNVCKGTLHSQYLRYFNKKLQPNPPALSQSWERGRLWRIYPAACRGNSTAGADRQGQAAVKRRCDAPLTARSRLYEKTGGDGGYIPPEP